MQKIYNNNILKRFIPAGILALMAFFSVLVLTVCKCLGVTLIQNLLLSDIVNTVNVILVVLLSIECVGLLIGAILSIIKVKYFLPFFILGMIFSIMIFSIGISNRLLSAGHIISLFFIIILAIIGIVYYLIGRFKYGVGKDEIQVDDESSNDFNNDRKNINKIRIINLLNILELVVSALVFFIPISIFTFNITECFVLIKGLFGSKELYEIIPCLVLILVYIYAIFKYFDVLRLYKVNKTQFLEASKKFSYFTFGIVIVFFMTGVIGANVIASTLEIDNVETYSFIPFLIFLPIMIVQGILIGNVGYETENKKLSVNKTKWMILAFVSIFSFITFLSLFLSIVSISSSDDPLVSFIVPDVELTPWDLLIKQSSVGESYSLLSFVILAIVLLTAILYALSITAVFSKSKEAKRICLASIFSNYIFILIMGLFGKYYQISFAITKEKLLSFLKTKYSSISSIIQIEDPVVTSQIFILIFVDTAIAILLLILKPFTKSDDELIGVIKLDSSSEPIKVEAGNSIGSNGVEAKINTYDFDACPSFTAIDLENDKFINDMNLRRAKLFENPTLSSLTAFIVDYARESRLHLSYTPEAIASFIAGLGATRLTILQGMSGTGKTSLPKIFLEAIMGNCEIIEVESSWKDKNELLGYYNEFSKVYTPKKFTRVLYKAALNPSIVTFVVLDEMNLSRIEYYFSDFLSLMENEPDKRQIQLTNVKIYRTKDSKNESYLGLQDNHTLHIPENVWFIGTANRDESTFEISDKVYDRAHTMNFNKRASKVRNYTQELSEKFLDYKTLNSMLQKAINSSDFDLESVDYIKNVEEILRPYNISFGNRIMNQIEAYVKIYSACFNNNPDAITEALEDILLSKVVAKLEFKTIEDKGELARKFEKLKLYKCSEFIKTLSEDI